MKSNIEKAIVVILPLLVLAIVTIATLPTLSQKKTIQNRAEEISLTESEFDKAGAEGAQATGNCSYVQVDPPYEVGTKIRSAFTVSCSPSTKEIFVSMVMKVDGSVKDSNSCHNGPPSTGGCGAVIVDTAKINGTHTYCGAVTEAWHIKKGSNKKIQLKGEELCTTFTKGQQK